MVPLCVHSKYTPLGGLLDIEEICKWAFENAIEQLALTDTNGLYGMQYFIQTCQKYGIKPIVGSEVIWKDNRVVVLCNSDRSYGLLCKLITALHMEELHHEAFKEYLDLLLEDGILFTDNKEILTRHQGKENLYYEVCPGYFKKTDQQWAQERGIALLASTRGYFLNEIDHYYYELIKAIDQNTILSEVKLPYYNKSCRLYGPLEMKRLFSAYPEALINTQKIARNITWRWKQESIIFPMFNGLSDQECKKILYQKSHAGLNRRYSLKDPDLLVRAKKRLDHELSVISRKGFSSYFLVVEDIVKNSPRTCGRGSAASSLVSYLLGITHVDPVEQNLFFDRFLNEQRIDPPDIDIDFPWDERDTILEYIFQKYRGHCAMVANHNTLQGKSSIREVAKVFGISEDEINFFLERFPRVDLNQTWKNILIHAQRLQGLFRTLSVHPGGVVITPRPINEYVPTQMTPKGLPIIHWEKEQTELAKLVKIDILGNRSLAVIRDTIEAVNKTHHKNYSYKDLDPLNDPKTKELLQSGQTMGVFYIESPATRMLLKRMRTSLFENIVIASSIIRPAANKFSIEFVKRLHGKRYKHLDPCLIPILEETYGIIVYQEQVTQVAMALSGFTSTEGNNLRKIIDKKDKKEVLQDYKIKFFEGAKKKGIFQRVINQVWEMILSFSGYSFCKAHSASYALVSYKSCYLKAHYPAEFMAAVISNRGGYYTTFSYLDECRRMDLKILPPDVNESNYDFYGNLSALRTGLSQIKGITQKGVQKILNERQQGPYKALADFLDRTKISFEDAKLLVKSRALASFKKSTYVNQMWEVYAYFASLKGQVSKYECAVLPKIQEYSPHRFIDYEFHVFGGAISFPHWALYKNVLSIKQRVRAEELKFFVGKEVLLFGLHVTSKKVRTSKGEAMLFSTFSDETSLFETVFFPGVYLCYQDLLQIERSFLIKGVVEETLGSLQVKVLKIKAVRGFIPNKKNLQVS